MRISINPVLFPHGRGGLEGARPSSSLILCSVAAVGYSAFILIVYTAEAGTVLSVFVYGRLAKEENMSYTYHQTEQFCVSLEKNER